MEKTIEQWQKGKGEGKWREEERVVGVPNREGKVKRRWTVAMVQEEAMGSKRLPQRLHTDDKAE